MREGNRNTCADGDDDEDEFEIFDRGLPETAQYALTE